MAKNPQSLMNPKQIRNELQKLEIKARKQKRLCGFPNCSQSAIRSHNISEDVLSTFSEKGHIRVLNINPWKGGLEIRSIGIDDATIFFGFCSKHDDKLFRSIDSTEMDVTYHNILLMNYRSSIQEKIKKKIKTEYYSAFLIKFSGTNNPFISLLTERVEQFKFNFKSINWYVKELLNSIEKKDKAFIYEVLEFPYYDVAASELFSFEPDFFSQIKRDSSNCHFIPFSEIFIHLIPRKKQNKLLVVVCSHEKDSGVFEVFLDLLKEKEKSKALSDILVLYLELWACSEMFYLKYLQPKMSELNRLFLETAHLSTVVRKTNINIFS